MSKPAGRGGYLGRSLVLSAAFWAREFVVASTSVMKVKKGFMVQLNFWLEEYIQH